METTFETIKKIVGDFELPCVAQNEYGEMIIIDAGKDDEGCFFKLTTAQKNDWCRVEHFYETGMMTETYEK